MTTTAEGDRAAGRATGAGARAPVGTGGPAHRLPTVESTWKALRYGLDLDNGLIGELGRRDISRTRVGTRRFVGLAKAEYVDHVLHAARLKYVKSAEFAPIRMAAGLNLLTDEGESWATHRGALNPVFARRRLNGLVNLMIEPVEEMTARYPADPGERMVLDLHEEMVQMTLRVVANALFSQDFGPIINSMHDLATKGLRAAEALNRLTMTGLMGDRSWRAVGRVSRSRVQIPRPLGTLQEVAHGLDDAVREVVDARIANPTDRPDLLNALLGADEGSWTRQRVYDEALTFMLAGHETTANALTWFWYLLALNPSALDRMLTEVDTVLQGRAPTVDDLGSLPWTQACVQESQRYFSAVPTLPRTAIEHDVIDGHHIRPGTTVVIPVQALHHDPRYWERPAEFDPSRFMPGAPRITR